MSAGRYGWALALSALAWISPSAVSAQQVPALVPVTGQLYLAPNVAAPQKYALRLVSPSGGVVFEQSGELRVDDRGHFEIFLGAGGEELTPQLLGKHGDLEVELELDGEVLDGRLPLGAVPYAKLAQEALSAKTLEGKAARDFRPAGNVRWDEIDGKPADLGSGSMSFMAPLERQNEQVKLIDCSPGEVLQSRGGSSWRCAPLPTGSGGGESIVAGPGLVRTGDTLGLISCLEGQTLGVLSGQWRCQAPPTTEVQLADRSIDGIKLKFDAVSGRELRSDAVEGRHIKNDSITGVDLAMGAIGPRELATWSVTTDKLALASVTVNQLGSAAVTAAKIAESAVETTKLANGAVTSAKLATGAVTADKLANGAVTGLKLADDVILDRHVGAGALSAAKIAGTAATLSAAQQTFGASTLHINTQTGRVGIGKIGPQHTLDVEGTISATSYRLSPARQVTLMVPAHAMSISPVAELNKLSAATVQGPHGVSILATPSQHVRTYMTATIEVQPADVITGFNCHHRANMAGGPLNYTATLYRQGLTESVATSLTQLQVTQPAGPSGGVQQAQAITLLNETVQNQHYYFIQIDIPTSTQGILHGCQVQLTRSAL